jgi:hypothetical protein
MFGHCPHCKGPLVVSVSGGRDALTPIQAVFHLFRHKRGREVAVHLWTALQLHYRGELDRVPIGHVARMTKAEFRKLKNCGAKATEEMREVLQFAGLDFAAPRRAKQCAP